MSRRKIAAKNIVVIFVLSYLFLNVTGFHLSPIWAHEHSERSIHYGPSKIAHIEEFRGGKLILGKYDRWLTCNIVHRTWLFFWQFGGGVPGYEYDQSKPLDYSWGVSYGFYRLYGIVNDKSIARVELTLIDGTVLSTTDFYDDLFLFTWWDNNGDVRYMKFIRGYDTKGNLVFEKKDRS